MKLSHPKLDSLLFRQNVPFIKTGFALDQAWFTGGRTSVSILRHGGIGQIVYFGRQEMAGSNMFKSGSPVSAWTKVFRLCVVIDGTSYYPEFNNTHLYPFGYVSECTVADVHFRHELLVVNDALIQRVAILSNPGNKKLSLKLIFHGGCHVETRHRKWSPWEKNEGIEGLSTVAIDSVPEEECRQQIKDKTKDVVRNHFPTSDSAYGETHIGLASNLALSMLSVHGGSKYYVYSEPFEDDASIFLVFSPSAQDMTNRAKELKQGVRQECEQLFASRDSRIASSPGISIPSSKTAQSCLSDIPSVIDSMEVKDVPGAFRAGNHYWVWLDLLLDVSGFLYANDAASLRDMLLFFNRLYDEERGIPCSVTAQFVPFHGLPFSSQCVFVVALYNYYCYTGDIATLRECHRVARAVIEHCLEKEVRGTGLIEGGGMPDFPAEQDGHDISSCGVSYYYQSVMCMRYLSTKLDEVEPGKDHARFASLCDAAAKRCRESFCQYFFDEEKGYFIDSISSIDFSKRLHYPNFAVQWLTPFAADLVGNREGRIADFMRDNFTRPHGIGGMFPTWDSIYPGDGNQFLAYYPSWAEAFYRNIMKRAGRSRELWKWSEDVTWFWQRYTIPEGFTYDAENEGFTPDNPGGKQPFGALAWYSVFFRAIIGFEVDERGVIISPSPVQEEFSVKNIVVRGNKIDITVSGKGDRTEVVVNGEKKEGPEVVIPFSALKKRNQIAILRAI